MLTSVIMPVYNKFKYLHESVQSIINQTHQEFELIIVDDGSDDESIKIIKTFNDPRIRLIELKENRGVSYATNVAVEAARSDYLVRMDADDLCHPQRIEKQLSFALKINADLVGCQFRTFTEEGEIHPGLLRYQKYSNTLVTPQEIIEHFTVMPTVLQGTMLLKKEILMQFPCDLSFKTAEDYEQLSRIIQSGKLVYKIPEVLYDYRYIKTSLSNTRRQEGVINGLKIKLNFIYDYFKVKDRPNKNIFIWGTKDFAGYLEEELRNEKYKAKVRAFTDFDSREWGQVKNGLPILSPDEMINRRDKDDLVITMWNIEREQIIKFLENHGWQRNINYFVFS